MRKRELEEMASKHPHILQGADDGDWVRLPEIGRSDWVTGRYWHVPVNASMPAVLRVKSG